MNNFVGANKAIFTALYQPNSQKALCDLEGNEFVSSVSEVHPPAHLALGTAHVPRSFTGEFGDRRQPRCFSCTHRLVCRHPFQHQLPSIITLIHGVSDRLRDPSVGSVPISRNPLARGGEIFHARATDHITVEFGSVLCPVFAVRAAATASAVN